MTFCYNLMRCLRKLTLVFIGNPTVKVVCFTLFSLKSPKQSMMLSEDLLYISDP